MQFRQNLRCRVLWLGRSVMECPSWECPQHLRATTPIGLSTAPRDLFLHQHVLEPTRFRQGERAHTLDLIFTNEVGMVKNMQYCPGLGNSDPVIIRFDLACYTVRHESKDPRLDFNRADFAKLNDLINRTDWSMTTDPTLGMEESLIRGGECLAKCS